jgi:hypothetical protein
MPIVLIVAIYTALGADFNTAPHEFARFKSYASCETAREHVETRSTLGQTYVAVCVPQS